MIYPSNQKPPIWSIDPGIVAYNCQRAGMPHPVGAWPMWEGGGSLARDYSGHGNHGTINGADWVADGLDFNGTSDYMDCGNGSSLELTNEFTICLNLIRNNDNSAWERILSKSSASLNIARAYDYWIQITSSDLLDVGVVTGQSSDVYLIGTSTITVGKPYHIIATKNSIQFEIFMDGKSDAIGITSGTMNDAMVRDTKLNLGRLASSLAWYYSSTISIQNLIIFNTELTNRQIKFISDNPYFMYQIPEELYGYVAGAPPTGNPFWYYNMLKRRNA